MISRFKISSFKLFFILISFFAVSSVEAAKLYFNDIYKATGSAYDRESNSLTNISSINGSGFKFTSANEADVSFSGNNIAGKLTYINLSNNQLITISGIISRQSKDGNTTLAVNFIPTDATYTNETGEAYVLIVPGKENLFSTGNNVGTSSDPIATVLNNILTTQNNSPIISINNVTVSRVDGYAIFTVSLSRAANASISFTPTLTDGTALAGTHYTNSLEFSTNGNSWTSISGSVSIAQNSTSIQLRVPIINYLALSSNVTYNLNTGVITGGNILNKDGAFGLGTITPIKEINVSGNIKLISCSGCSVNAPSFTVSGSGLDTDITITAPTGVQVSTYSSTSFANSITLTANNGSVTTTTIYAKLINNATTASSGVISVTSTGATSKTITVTTNTDNALNFDGSNDYISLSSNIPYTNNAITIDAWIRSTASNSGGIDDIISWGNTTYGSTSTTKVNVVEFRVYNGKLSFVLNDNSTFYEITSRDYVNTGKWVHVAVVKSGTNVTLYINGQADTNPILASTNTSSTAPTSAPLPNVTNIGALGYNGGLGYGITNGSSFLGDIDQIRVWNTVKNITDISTNRFVEMSGNESGLVASYDFNQGVANGSNGSLTVLNNINSDTYTGTLNSFALTGTSSNFVTGFIPEITAAGSATSVAVGNTLQLSNGLTGGTWASSNTSYATVNTSGLVTGVASGSVTITYTICNKVVTYYLSVIQPTITTSGTLKTFTTCSGCTVNPQSFTLSGSNLGADILLTAPSGVVMSTTSGGTYSSSLSLTQSSGVVSSTTIYVKLSNNSLSNAGGNINIMSTGAVSKTMSVTTNTDNA